MHHHLNCLHSFIQRQSKNQKYKKNWANSPGWGRKKRANAAPGIVAFLHFCGFFINQWIKRSKFQYFNAMVLKTSRTTLCASLFWLYVFLYILFSTKFKENFFVFLYFWFSLCRCIKEWRQFKWWCIAF